jgi:hypothetical protein
MALPITQAVMAQVMGTAWHEKANQLCALEYEGDPTNNVTPVYPGQFCKDISNNDLYWAATGASSGWKKLNN